MIYGKRRRANQPCCRDAIRITDSLHLCRDNNSSAINPAKNDRRSKTGEYRNKKDKFTTISRQKRRKRGYFTISFTSPPPLSLPSYLPSPCPFFFFVFCEISILEQTKKIFFF